MILAAVFSNVAFLHKKTNLFSYKQVDRWVFGGPVKDAEASGNGGLPEVTAGLSVAVSAESGQEISIDSYASFFGGSEPYGGLAQGRNGLKNYTIKKGDTISSIAAEFGLTVQTINSANPNLKSRALKVGDKLTILPVSGILYELKDGDTIESVASRFRIEADLIKEHNSNYQKAFASPGQLVILPYAKPLANVSYVNRYVGGLADLKDYFALPLHGGFNWGELHEYNAVDIADQCGKQIYASAEGLVVSDEKLGNGGSGWNNGYGLFVLIEHPNGTRTRYAHNSKNLVSAGDYVSQGQEIALIGNTGNAHGPSGCHIHFEVYGARNPFAKK